MDIHKPKPWHGAREFFKEIGTIVIGVLIALGAEQAVEALRWGHEVTEARQALATELAKNAGAVEEMSAQDACLAQRLQLLQRWASGGATIDSTNLDAPDNRPVLRTLTTSAWEVAKASDVAAHMPISERNAYAAANDGITNQQQRVVREREAWLQLARYAGKGKLEHADALRLREDIATARALAADRQANSDTLIHRARELGVQPSRDVRYPSGRSVRDLCRAPH